MRPNSLVFPLLLAVAAFCPAASAAVGADDLPAGTTWYFHADLERMRATDAGASLYAWLESEVFSEIREESGIDLGKEVNRVTAFATQEDGAIMVVDGRFSQSTRDKALAAASAAERFDLFKSGGKTYYYVRGDDADREVDIDGIDNEFYFSFDVRDKLVVAAKKGQMEALLANNGRIPGSRSNTGTLFVLTAEHSLIQAGLDTDGIDDDDDGGFQSNIMRNTKHVAVMIADVAGKIAIEAQLVATEAATAQSLASIVRGLIALQAFSTEMDPDIARFLQNTRVDVDDVRLKISVALTPEMLAAALDEA